MLEENEMMAIEPEGCTSYCSQNVCGFGGMYYMQYWECVDNYGDTQYYSECNC